MKRYITLGLALLTMMTGNAKEPVEGTLAVDFVSQYVWRGLELGHTSIQPTLGIGWKGLSLQVWGNAGIGDSADPHEIDLTASYTTKGLTIGLVDYWSDTPDQRYFYYPAHGTSHVFEAFACYDFGPVSTSWQTIFAGNDGLNQEGKRAYSSYLEVAAPFQLASCDWQATMGMVPYATTYYETTGLAITNVSLRVTKEISITDHFTLPIYGQIVANPCSGRAWFVFGLTLSMP